MVESIAERRAAREQQLEERDIANDLAGVNPDVPFVGVRFPAMVDPKAIKFTRNGDMTIGFIVPARYVDTMIQIRAAMRSPVMLDIQRWKPDGTER